MSCKHYADGKCALGLYGGSPKLIQCAACGGYEGPIRGLGDVVAKVTQVTGIAAVAPKHCGGCGKRRAALNGKFPVGTQPPTEP